jgi:uncharacterized RDD family membrane protein YckC
MAYCKNCGYTLPEGAVYCPRCGTAVTKKEEAPVGVPPSQPAEVVSPSTSVASELKLAYWWERFLAWLIDVAIISAASWIVSFVAGLGGIVTSFNLLPGWLSWIPFFSFGLTGVLQFLYWTIMEGTYAQSFGKMVLRIKVTRLDGSRPSLGHSALQSLGKAFILWIDALLGWILYPKRRQRVFNFLSGTIVVRAAGKSLWES